MSNRIQFYYEEPVRWFKKRLNLKSFILKLFRNENKKIDSIRFIFCTDSYLLGINQTFLKHDYYTDIITFELSAPGEAIEAEIYISVDRVVENAKSNHCSREKELHRVIFHGLLHLLGYKDKLKHEKEQMRSMEDRYLKKYFSF